ncbi:MAG: hypothetical protein U0263_06390 [Polyangiaceae bacterium]
MHVEDLEEDERGESQREPVALALSNEPVPEYDQRSGRHRRAVEQELAESAPRQDRVIGPARGNVHDARARRVESERHGRWTVHDDVDPEQLDGGERRGQAEERGARHRQDRADVGGELESHEFDDIFVNGAALLDGADDGREVVVGQDHRSGLFGHLGPRESHGDADVGVECGRVVDAVTVMATTCPVAEVPPRSGACAR